MTYYRVVHGDVFDHKTGYTTIPGELLTLKERCKRFSSLSDRCFEAVQVSRAKTFWMFGARFEMVKG